MVSEFGERRHLVTSSFHFPQGDMSITLDNFSCLFHIPIRGRLFDHDKIIKDEVVVMMLPLCSNNADPGNVLQELEVTRRCHARFQFLENLDAQQFHAVE